MFILSSILTITRETAELPCQLYKVISQECVKACVWPAIAVHCWIASHFIAEKSQEPGPTFLPDDLVFSCWSPLSWHSRCVNTVVSLNWMRGLRFFTQCCHRSEHNLLLSLNLKVEFDTATPLTPILILFSIFVVGTFSGVIMGVLMLNTHIITSLPTLQKGMQFGVKSYKEIQIL